MKQFIVIILLVITTNQAQARWSCNLACHISEDRPVAQILRHSSGTAYSDFNAECKQVKGQSTFPGESGCDYVYCKVYDKRIDVVSGFGETLTEARQNARTACGPQSKSYCKLLNVRTLGNYDCREH